MSKKSILWKFGLTCVLLVWCLASLMPLEDKPLDAFLTQQVRTQKEAFKDLLARAQLQVQTEQSPSLLAALKAIGQQEKVDFSSFFPHISVTDIKNISKRNDILLDELYKRAKGKLRFGLDLQGGLAFTLKINQAKETADSLTESRLTKTIEILDKRTNSLGVTEPLIRARGKDSVEIQLPGLSPKGDQNVLNVLKKPAKLTFHSVHPSATPDKDPLPVGYQRLIETRENPRTGEAVEVPVYLKRVPEAGGDIIQDAIPSVDPQGNYYISLQFTAQGSQIFAQLTRKIAQEGKKAGRTGQMAIVLDGVLYSAPTVREEIAGGRASIEGRFTQRQVLELANVLNNPLEFELSVEEMAQVGPSLAKDARESSIKACLLGAGLVMAFMVLYYGLAGAVAVVSVLINVFIVVGTMASIGATITLPGIAALVLTVGMGVDANILIFERMREELKRGFGMREALVAGYDRALATILDANITTLLTALILIAMGTGPIKGFGVTLGIGICASVFCALVVSRFMLDYLVSQGLMRRLSLLNWFSAFDFDFIKHRRTALMGCTLLLGLGLAGAVVRNGKMYGVDFTGGDLVTLSYTQKLETQSLTDFAQRQGFGDLSPVYEHLIGENQDLLKVQCEFGQGERLVETLKKAFPNGGLETKSISAIGPSVTQGLKWNALISLLAATLGILIYIAFRFELGFGIAAFISTVHDVFMTVGIFILMGGRFSAPMVASILMIIGYSINDTIVVFDRIREELQNNPSLSLGKIINLSINQTLSRTLLTSLTTFMSAFALYWFGAGIINDFALVFLIGIVVGTFSSIFIASPIFYWWHRGDRRKLTKNENASPQHPWQAEK